jgi:hypothetical protein
MKNESKIMMKCSIILLLIIFQYSCSHKYPESDHVKIYRKHPSILDSLISQPNDFIFYLKGCDCFYFTPEVVYTITYNDSLIEIVKYDNFHKNKSFPVLKRNTSIFKDLIELIPIDYIHKYPMMSSSPYYELSLRIQDISYNFSTSSRVYDNQALNYIKSYLLDLEIDNEFIFE